MIFRRQRAAFRTEELQQQWKRYTEKLSFLEQEKITETRSEERFRLEQDISRVKEERQLVEKELEQLEAQLSETGTVPETEVPSSEIPDSSVHSADVYIRDLPAAGTGGRRRLIILSVILTAAVMTVAAVLFFLAEPDEHAVSSSATETAAPARPPQRNPDGKTEDGTAAEQTVETQGGTIHKSPIINKTQGNVEINYAE